MAELRLDRLAPVAVTLLRVVAATAGRAEPVALVGGAVRDALVGRPALDVDVAVPAGGLALARRVAETVGGTLVVLDEERGAARVVVGPARLDVTDFRAPTLEADLVARDFTVNALAVRLPTLLAAGRARVVDPGGGVADLRARRLRLPAPGVLHDDPLRTLRGVRLEATHALRLTPAAARAVRAAAPGLARVAAERVRDELLVLLALPRTLPSLRRAHALGCLTVVLPEVQAMQATIQPAPHRFDVLEHSLRAVGGVDALLPRLDALEPLGHELRAHVGEGLGGGVTRAQTLKLAALLHDVSKPETRRVIGGRVRFLEHDVLGAARTRAIGERLRLPGRAVDVLERLVRHHLRPMHLAQAGGISRRARYRFYRDLREDTRDLLLLVLADAGAVTGASPLAAWRRSVVVRDLLGGWAEEHAAAAEPPLVRGHDVMARYGLAPGPEVGRLLDQAREAQGLGLVHTRDEALRHLDSCRGAP